MHNCITCLLGLPMFDGLEMHHFREICLKTVKRTLKKGEYLFRIDEPSDTVYLVKNGTLKLVQWSEDGKEIIVDIVGKGHVLGESALFKMQRNIYDAISMDHVSICSFSLKSFEALISQEPQIAMSIIANLGEKLYNTMQYLGSASNHSVESKLLSLLFRLAKEHGKEVQNGQQIMIHLTQEDMGNMIGTSRVMISQTMKKFIAVGSVEKKGKYYILRDKCGKS